MYVKFWSRATCLFQPDSAARWKCQFFVHVYIEEFLKIFYISCRVCPKFIYFENPPPPYRMVNGGPRITFHFILLIELNWDWITLYRVALDCIVFTFAIAMHWLHCIALHSLLYYNVAYCFTSRFKRYTKGVHLKFALFLLYLFHLLDVLLSFCRYHLTCSPRDYVQVTDGVDQKEHVGAGNG